MSKRIALAFGLACAIIIAALLILHGRSNAMKQNQGGDGFGESRAVPTNKTVTVFTPAMALDGRVIEDEVAERLRIAGYSTNFAPVKVIGGGNEK